MTLAEELERIAAPTGADAVLAAEAQPGERIYVCAFEDGAGGRTWLAFDGNGEPVAERRRVATRSRSSPSASWPRRRRQAATSTSSGRSSRRFA